MDLSPIQNALTSGSYATIADTCDELVLQARSPPFRVSLGSSRSTISLFFLIPIFRSYTLFVLSNFSLPLGESAIKTTGPTPSIFLAISLSMTCEPPSFFSGKHVSSGVDWFGFRILRWLFIFPVIAQGFCGSLCPWRIRRARRRLLLYGRLENASGIGIILGFMKLFVSSNGALKLLAWSLLSQVTVSHLIVFSPFCCYISRSL